MASILLGVFFFQQKSPRSKSANPLSHRYRVPTNIFRKTPSFQKRKKQQQLEIHRSIPENQAAAFILAAVSTTSHSADIGEKVPPRRDVVV